MKLSSDLRIEKCRAQIGTRNLPISRHLDCDNTLQWDFACGHPLANRLLTDPDFVRQGFLATANLNRSFQCTHVKPHNQGSRIQPKVNYFNY
jgi:hypothetical protein